MTRALDRDPSIMSLPETAAFLGIATRTLRDQLHDDPTFEAAVVVVIGKRRFVSRVRLEEYLHGRRVAS